MLCDKQFGAPSPTPHIQTEHSYSLSSVSEPGSPVSSGFTEDGQYIHCGLLIKGLTGSLYLTTTLGIATRITPWQKQSYVICSKPILFQQFQTTWTPLTSPLLDPETNQPILVKSEPAGYPTEAHYILKEPLPNLVPAPGLTRDAKQAFHMKPKQEVIKIKLEPMMLDYQMDNSTIGKDIFNSAV